MSQGTGATTGEAGVSPPRVELPKARGVDVPRGFRAEVYAKGLEHPTAMAFGPDGRLYVTEDVGKVVRVRAGTTSPRSVANGVDVPLGLAWLGRRLVVSERGGLVRLRLRDRRLVGRTVLVSGLPFGAHQQDNVVARSGRLYFGSGSTCNACVEGDPRSATVLSVRPDGSDLRIVSRGLRNPYGLAVQPGTNRLFVSVNGRDDLGDGEPADSVVVVRHGRDFGWPACWPSFATRTLDGDCAGVTPPVVDFEPHSSADGMAFYTGSSFPPRFRGDLFVALWGQYSSEDHGRRVVRLKLGPDGITGRQVFVRGLPHPLALAVGPGGALLVADWQRGAIYRIQAKGAH